ncbi:MAG: CPBP family intramembrane metalloprotease [Candidatus Latescibacteria bacterium]|nr:CPBP family intramembrane metalloprotease [Candidatus Latescibacterota bacterium]
MYPSLRKILYLALGTAVLSQLLLFPVFAQRFSPQLSLIATELSVLWLVILFVRWQPGAAEELLLLNATPLRALILTIPLALSGSLLISQFDLHWGRFLSTLGYALPLHIQRNLIEVQLAGDLAALLFGLVAVVLSPGIAEELLFRGLVFAGLYVHRGPRLAVAGAGLFFALVHFNPWQLPALILLGVLLGMLVYWTHSIYPAILAHMLNNALSFAGLNLKVYWGLEALAADRFYSPPLVLALLLVFAASALRLRRIPPIMPLPPKARSATSLFT